MTSSPCCHYSNFIRQANNALRENGLKELSRDTELCQATHQPVNTKGRGTMGPKRGTG